MTTAPAPTPRDVSTTLNYHFALDDEPPYQYALQEPPPGTKRTNVTFETHPVVVHDARGREDELTLDTTGFQFLVSPSTEKAFDNDERIKFQYYPEVEALLKKVTGAKRVFIFNHIVRRSIDKEMGMTERNRGPVEGVHVDQAYDATVKRVHEHLPEEADRLLQSRVRLINVWRPIANPVAHKPLGVSDWRFLDERDLVPVRLIMRHREGRTFSVRYSPNHRWYYLSSQTPDEVTLIKCYDSEVDGRARLSPHSAFLDPTSPKDAPHRQSIEVRALVFDAD
ncbi:uncharacterized protein TRAVEDRAFT_51674 [Trametes versicolor FP-101664 SS1]|uniref:uncharacterized protein n=1 Tax=Trametes versicolor (strain FP-101664) TaxID=717944 RepID=UPI0004623987|nr:uncharacterized protein TRAVEDRAFT_51674 [Trametes versicolor FP-101664 SS1]EIW53936.1 hypothetical protein TRAVEDRAFT_51674 [Trametes versicolor FP-101664 SS1]